MNTRIALTDSALRGISDQYQQDYGKYTSLVEDKTASEIKLSETEKQVDTWQKVQLLFTKSSDYARTQLKARIEETVTAALNAVFGEGMEFLVNLRESRDQAAADWQVVSRYNDMTVVGDPETARGGGVTDIVSLALRLSLLELARPKPDGPLILDEPGKMVSREYLPGMAKFLSMYAERLGRQIIMVTHADELAEQADMPVRVTKGQKGESVVAQHA